MNRRQISGWWSDAVSTFLRSSRHSTLVMSMIVYPEWKSAKKRVYRQIERGFSSFFAKFLAYFMIFPLA